MDAIFWTDKLWDKSKILFWLLIPIVLLGLVYKVYMMYNMYAAKASINNAQKTDNKLLQAENAAKQDAAVALKKANDAQQSIENRKTEEGVPDWNKTWGKK